MPASSIVTERGGSRRQWGLVVIAAVIVLDQITKWWAVRSLVDGRVIHVVWTLRFSLGYNSGFAFGTGQRFGVVVGLVALGVVVAVVRSMLRSASTPVAIALALIAGGASGNIIDRVFRHGGLMRGRVVDFIDLQWWPVFNIADSAITVGAVLLVIGSIIEWRQPGGDSPAINTDTRSPSGGTT